MSLIVEESTLLTNLQKFFGYESFKGDQEAIIKNLLEGNDTFVIMPTGGGKSMCYQLPALILLFYHVLFYFRCGSMIRWHTW